MFHIRRGAADEPLRRLKRLRDVEVKQLQEPVGALVNQKTAARDDRHPCPQVHAGPAACWLWSAMEICCVMPRC